MAHHGDDAYERKLRPLYDALDARSYKQAVKLAESALKKYRNDQLVRALKGYALHRSGKPEEALQLMRDIVAEGPEAERVVMTMAYTYKAAGQMEAISQAYVAAAEKHPRDPDILMGLYKSYVREFNFVKQQQVAMKLSKLLPPGPDNMCSWWIVCSLALQARAALLQQDQHRNPLPSAGSSGAASGGGSGTAPAGGLAADKLLQLAETMAARLAAAAAAQQPQQGPAAVGLSYEALLLYLDILQGQGKARQALEVVEGPLGGAVPLPADRLQLRAAALVRAGDLPAAAACYRQSLAAAPDDWLSWQLYLDCMLPGSGIAAADGGNSMGSRFPVRVVGGLADIWDRRQLREQQKHVVSCEDAAAALDAVEESTRQLSGEVSANASWRNQLEQGTLRGPHLWRCELLLRRQHLAIAAARAANASIAAKPSIPQDQQQELATAVGEAFAKLAANFSCVSDLRAYLAALSGPAAEQLATEVHRRAAELNAQDAAEGSSAGAAASGGTVPNTNGSSKPAAAGGAVEAGNSKGGGVSGEIRRLQRLVNAHQVELELGLPRHCTPDEAAAHAKRLLDLYRRHMHLSAGLDEKERGYGEELVVAAVEALMAAAVLEMAAAPQGQSGAAPPLLERAIARMLQAVLALEAAQQRRKVSAPLRLAATALYSLLGAPKLAAAQFAALDIKSIQHDSMTGHWLLPLLAGGGTGDLELRRWVEGCVVLHELHQADAGDTLATALESGTYSKVSEFVSFKERLQHSHTRALAAVARTLLVSNRPGSKAADSSSGSGGTRGNGQGAVLQHVRQLLVGSAEREVEGGREGTSCGGALLRFNEDLSTRPSWYPPGSASSSAVADWWQAAAEMAREGQNRPGYAQCWWSAPLVAESARREAAALRQRHLAELRTRVGWALTVSGSLDSAADGAALLEQLQPLVQPQQPTAAQQEQQQAPAGVTSLQAAACAAALAALQALAGLSQVDAEPVRQLSLACLRRGRQVAVELALLYKVPVLPGSVTSLAAAVVADCRGIAAVCSRLLKLAVAAGATQQPLAAALAEAADAAAAAASAVKKAAGALLEATEPDRQIAQALQLLESCSGSSGGDAGLWAFEPAFEVQPVVAALVKAQLSVVQSTQE